LASFAAFSAPSSSARFALVLHGDVSTGFKCFVVLLVRVPLPERAPNFAGASWLGTSERSGTSGSWLGESGASGGRGALEGSGVWGGRASGVPSFGEGGALLSLEEGGAPSSLFWGGDPQACHLSVGAVRCCPWKKAVWHLCSGEGDPQVCRLLVGVARYCPQVWTRVEPTT
jgi:hypothetical protein